MVRKKNKGQAPGSGVPSAKTPDAKSALVKDASEVRALMERAQRLLRGEADPPQALSDSSSAALEDDTLEEQSLPDPNVLVSPRPKRRSGDDEASADEAAEESDEVALDSLPDAFVTTTMATMLLSQGRAADARAIFERVLAKTPDDSEAARGLEKAEAALLAESHGVLSLASSASLLRKHVPQTLSISEGEHKEPDGLLERAPPPWGYDVDELRVLPVDPTTIVVFWELREGTIERVAREMPGRNTLMLRVVSLVRGADGQLGRVERLEGPVSRVGDWFVWGLANGTSHEVSVGLAGRSGFTAILTAEAVATPRGAPAKARSAVRARIVLPERTRVVSATVSRIAEVIGPAEVLGALRDTRTTPALEDARFVAEQPTWLEESVGDARAVPPRSTQPRELEHWSEAIGEAPAGGPPPQEAPLLDVWEWSFAPGSSWSLSLSIARRHGNAPTSPSSPGPDWAR